MSQQPRLLFGKSRAITKALDLARAYAPHPDILVLLGEPGTGKSAMAEYIHELSGRSGKFIKESASNIPDSLIVSTLAGYRRGAFTGASEPHCGLIEAAHNGTFFLDELGEASPALQQFLRRVLDDRAIQPLNQARPIPVNVRFIFATNADLEAEVENGRFRRDLYHRLGFFRIPMPRLADRRDEILALMDFFFEREAARRGLAGRVVLDDEVRDVLRCAPWVGNVRDLEHLCSYLTVWYHSQSGPRRPIALCDLPPSMVLRAGDLIEAKAKRQRTAQDARAALAHTKGDKTAAAQLLGVSRRTIYRWLGDV